MNLHRNLSFRVAMKYAKELGATVESNSAGETVFKHPFVKRRYRATSMKKDAGRALVGWIRQLCRRLGRKFDE